MPSKQNQNTFTGDSLKENSAKRSLSEACLAGPYFFSKKELKTPFFTSKELADLSATSKILHRIAQPELNQRLLCAAQELLTQVVLDKQDKAEAIIEANPGLLLIKSHAVDYSRALIIATPFQAALDTENKSMQEMMLKYMDPEEALRQFHEWFPNGIKDIPLIIDNACFLDLRKSFYAP